MALRFKFCGVRAFFGVFVFVRLAVFSIVKKKAQKVKEDVMENFENLKNSLVKLDIVSFRVKSVATRLFNLIEEKRHGVSR